MPNKWPFSYHVSPMSWYSLDRLRGKLIPILFLLATISLILLFASGLSTVRLQPGGDLNVFAILLGRMEWPSVEMPSTAASSGQGPALGWLRTIFWIIIPFVLIYAIVSPRYRRLLLRTAIMVFVLIFVMERLRRTMTPKEEGETGLGLGQLPDVQAAATLPPPPDFVSSTPDWAVWSINLLLALAIVGVAWFLWRVFRPVPEEDPQAAVAQEAQTALHELEEGGNLREVILRCYAQMSRLMRTDRNVHRHRAMTPRDFERHLADRGFSDEHISRLTRLFESVRYSSTEPGSEAQEEAVACLTAIVDEHGTQSRQMQKTTEPASAFP